MVLNLCSKLIVYIYISIIASCIKQRHFLSIHGYYYDLADTFLAQAKASMLFIYGCFNLHLGATGAIGMYCFVF